MEPYTVA